MNGEHKDIRKILPYGEQLRGFANQRYISQAELYRILKERGIFVLNVNKDFMVPLLQTLILSPKEFDKIRDAFLTKEDNNKVISRDIKWVDNIQIYSADTLAIDVNDFIKKKLPTCELEQPIKFIQVNDNPNDLKADFKIKRYDINKSWYEQTNEFPASIEFINENEGKGRVIITHTAPETKELAEFVVKEQLKKYKEKGFISKDEQLRKITFKDFTNRERFVFFFRLTNKLQCDYFECENIKDISIKPEETTLPEEIKWMEDMNKILLSGKSLDKKYFIGEEKYHENLILWEIEALFTFTFKGHIGECVINFGFPDFSSSKLENAEFELNISSVTPKKTIDSRSKKILKSELLSEMDRQKSIVYNEFLEYKDKKNGY